jgi:hypothetical protein
MPWFRAIVCVLVAYFAIWMLTWNFAPRAVERHIEARLKATSPGIDAANSINIATVGCPGPFLVIGQWEIRGRDQFHSQSKYEGWFLCVPWHIFELSHKILESARK